MILWTIFIVCAKWFADKLLAPIILIGLAFVLGNFFLGFTIHRDHEERQSLVVVDRFYETSLINLMVMSAEYTLPEPVFEAQRARFRSLQADARLLGDTKVLSEDTRSMPEAPNPASLIVDILQALDPLVQGSTPPLPQFSDMVETPSQPGTSRLRSDLPKLIEVRIRSCHQVMRYMVFARNVGPTRLHRWLAQFTANARLRRPTEHEEICYADR